jgi:hypothetical protein
MSSLHSRRPPKLEQGELRRGKQSGLGGGSVAGVGILRRPPNSSERNDSIGDTGSKGKKRFCSVWKMISLLVLLSVLSYLFVRMRFMFREWVMNSSSSGLRAKQDAVLTTDSV